MRSLRLLFLGAFAVVAGAPTFGSTEVLDPKYATGGLHAIEPLSVDSSGRAFYATKRVVGSDEQAVVLQRCSGTPPWGDAVVRGDSTQLNSPHDLVVTPSGRAILVWVDENSSVGSVWSSVRSAAGAWGPPQRITTGATVTYSVDVAMNDAGDAAVVWFESGYDPVASYRPAATGVWEAPHELEDDLNDVAVAMAPSGEAAFAGPDPSDNEVGAVIRSAGGAWGAFDKAEDLGTITGLRAAYDGQGRLTVVYGDGTTKVLVQRRTGTAWLNDPIELGTVGAFKGLKDVAPYAGGVAAVWTEIAGGTLGVATVGASVNQHNYAADYATGTVAVDTAGEVLVAGERDSSSGGREIWGTILATPASAWPAQLERYSAASTSSSLLYRDPVAAGGGGLVLAWGVHASGGVFSTQARATTAPPACAGGGGGGSQNPPPQPPPPPVVTQPKPKFADFMKLPKAARCVKNRKLRIKLTKSLRAKVAKVSVKVNGKKRKLKRGVNLTRLPARGRYTVAVTITLKDGTVLKGKRRYRGCA
jgi:hypothetical protein